MFCPLLPNHGRLVGRGIATLCSDESQSGLADVFARQTLNEELEVPGGRIDAKCSEGAALTLDRINAQAEMMALALDALHGI